MLRGLVESLLVLFSGARQAPVRAAVAAPLPPGASPTRPAPTPAPAPDPAAAFAARLERMAADPDGQGAPLVASSVELTGFEDIRNALGADWSAISERAVKVVVAELVAHLGESDLYLHYGDFSFMVCFAGLDRAAAEARATELSGDIKFKLAELLPELAPAIEVEHFTAEVDRDKLRLGAGPLQDQLYRTLKHMRVEAKAAAQRSRFTLLRDFQVQFAPVWHTAKRMAVLNRCVLDMTSGFRTLAQFQAVAEPAQIRRTLAELDSVLLTKAIEALHKAVRSKVTGALLVPVTFRTLEGEASLAEYRRLLDMVPTPYRRLLFIEVTDVPDNTSAPYLMQVTEPVRPYTSGISFDLRIDYPDLARLLVQQPWGIAADVGGIVAIDARVLYRLRQFASAAAAAHVMSLAHGATSVGLAAATFEAGFSYIDGPAVHPTLREPKAPSPLNPLSNARLNLQRARW